MIRCGECKKPTIQETKHTDWLQLFHFINFLFSEEYIEQATRDSMLDSLMSLKDFIVDKEVI